jgi:hypothetical protein
VPNTNSYIKGREFATGLDGGNWQLKANAACFDGNRNQSGDEEKYNRRERIATRKSLLSIKNDTLAHQVGGHHGRINIEFGPFHFFS